MVQKLNARKLPARQPPLAVALFPTRPIVVSVVYFARSLDPLHMRVRVCVYTRKRVYACVCASARVRDLINFESQ